MLKNVKVTCRYTIRYYNFTDIGMLNFELAEIDFEYFVLLNESKMLVSKQ